MKECAIVLFLFLCAVGYSRPLPALKDAEGHEDAPLVLLDGLHRNVPSAAHGLGLKRSVIVTSTNIAYHFLMLFISYWARSFVEGFGNLDDAESSAPKAVK